MFVRGKRETLRISKPSTIVFGLIAAVVVSVGFIAGLAILAPQQLAEAAVTARDVICNGCVGTSDIAPGAITLHTVMRTEGALVIGPGDYGTSEAHCRSGEILTGGGFDVGTANSSNDLEQMVIIHSAAGGSSTAPNSWMATAYNNGPDTGAVTAYAICATLSP